MNRNIITEADVISMERRFCRFIEHNDHEGERWSWWLQLTGNEDELVKLSVLMEGLAFDDLFELHMDVVEPEHVVDLLVLYADDEGDYNPAHNKVRGEFTSPTDLGDDHGAVLYKGGINAFFKTKEAQA